MIKYGYDIFNGGTHRLSENMINSYGNGNKRLSSVIPVCRMLPLYGCMQLISSIVIAFVSAAQLAALPSHFFITEPEIILILVCQRCGTVVVHRLTPIDEAVCTTMTEL